LTAEEVAALLAEGVVEQVKTDIAAARRNLLAAHAHLRTAETAAFDDSTGAFVLAYDAMRKAIVAHMSANGFRVTGRPGAHERTGRYARAALAGHDVEEHVAAFDDLRRLRNKTEYNAVVVTEAAVVDAVAHA
jgi:hypothetical protein